MENNQENSAFDFIITADGSKTLYNPKVGEAYHSKNGALQESLHVFVKNGLSFYHQKNNTNSIKILEVGFGTGLNALLSFDYAYLQNVTLQYVGIEAYPLKKEQIISTDYGEFIQNKNLWDTFIRNYEESFKSNVNIEKSITLQLFNKTLLDFNSDEKFDIVYFDAFAKHYQAEMWTEETIKYACSFLKDKGIFVTYSVTGELKRTLKTLGFEIERPEGAAGKREMMRATLQHVI